MPSILFATTNTQKLELAQAITETYGYSIEAVRLEIDEIQGESPEPIIRDKAQRAYELLGRPVVVSDDSWGIHALNGFPGPYMKSINHWFAAEDFMTLMQDRSDRSITLYQYLAYTDGESTKVFCTELHGQIVDSPRGDKSKYPPIMQVVALDQDDGQTIAEVFDQGSETFKERYKTRRETWNDLMDWYTNLDANTQ